MKAIRLYGKEDLRLEDVNVPEISEDEILIKTKSAALCGTDIRMYKNGVSGIDKDHPLIIGHEISGIIEQVGKQVRGYRTGMRVAVAPNMGCGTCDRCVSGNTHLCADYQALGINLDGGFAEYVRIPKAAVIQGNIKILEDHMGFDEAAVAEPLSCVYNGQEQAGIHPGDKVLVIGAGPIGLMHGMLAKMQGAGMVMMNDLSAERLAYCKSLYPYMQTIEADSLRETVMRLTKNRGADVIIVACPSGEMQSMAIELAGLFGRVLFFGGLPKDREKVSINSNLIHYKQISIHGSTRASLSQYRKVLDFAADGVIDLKQLVTHVYEIGDYQKAFSEAVKSIGLKHVIRF
jgi:L-iditol 2-dehydrogenase